MWCSSAVNLCFLSFLAAFVPVERGSHVSPGTASGTRCARAFPLACRLPSTASAADRPGLVRQLLRYYAAVRLPASVPHRRAPLGFPMRSAASLRGRRTRDLPVPVRECFRACAGSLTARGPLPPRHSGAPVWPSAYLHSLGTPDHPLLSPRGMDFAAQYPARAYPCQRFAHTLTNDARMTRGRRSWLSLQRMTLSFTTLSPV